MGARVENAYNCYKITHRRRQSSCDIELRQIYFERTKRFGCRIRNTHISRPTPKRHRSESDNYEIFVTGRSAELWAKQCMPCRASYCRGGREQSAGACRAFYCRALQSILLQGREGLRPHPTNWVLVLLQLAPDSTGSLLL